MGTWCGSSSCLGLRRTGRPAKAAIGATGELPSFLPSFRASALTWRRKNSGRVSIMLVNLCLRLPIIRLFARGRQALPIIRWELGGPARRARGGKGARGPLADVEQVLEEQRDYAYMQNGFNVFMSNADGEGASMPEADVD